MYKHIYIGIDIATVTGIAIYNPIDNISYVIQYKGDPIQLFGFITHNLLIMESPLYPIYVLELPTHFRNATTTRNLLERYGFIKYSLMNYNHLPVEVNLNSVRAYFSCKTKANVKSLFLPKYQGNKKFTDNHSDALACAIYQSVKDGFGYAPGALKILEMETR